MSFEDEEYHISTLESLNSEMVFYVLMFYLIIVDSLANCQVVQIQVLRKILFHCLN